MNTLEQYYTFSQLFLKFILLKTWESFVPVHLPLEGLFGGVLAFGGSFVYLINCHQIIAEYWTLFFLSMLQVRTRFIAKLHKGLARGIPFKCLPLDFLGFYAMVGMETDKTVREGTKRYMIGDINSRKDCIKTMTYSSCKFLTLSSYINSWSILQMM